LGSNDDEQRLLLSAKSFAQVFGLIRRMCRCSRVLSRGEKDMKTFLIAVTFLVCVASSANAWGSCCDPQLAKKNYVCALVNCLQVTATLGLTTDAYVNGALSGTDLELLPTRIDVLPRDYSVWAGVDQQGKNVDLQQLRKLDNAARAAFWVSVPRMIAGIKSAPIDDYHCQVILMFDDKALAEVTQSLALMAMISNPLLNPLGFAMIASGNLQNIVGMMAAQGPAIAQNLKRSIVYTEGLDLQADDIWFNAGGNQ
jgi:hypothetical protein